MGASPIGRAHAERATEEQRREVRGSTCGGRFSFTPARTRSRFAIAAFGERDIFPRFAAISTVARRSADLPIPIRAQYDPESLPSFRTRRNPRRESSHAAGVRSRPRAANFFAVHTFPESWKCTRPTPRAAGRKALVRSLCRPQQRVHPRSDDASRQQFSAQSSRRRRAQPRSVPGSMHAAKPFPVRSCNPPRRSAANFQHGLVRVPAHCLRSPNLASISHWISAKTMAVDTPNRSMPLAASSGPRNLQCGVMTRSP